MKFELTKHGEMWEYLATHADDIVMYYCMYRNYGCDEEDAIMRYKLKFLAYHNYNVEILNVCYACDYCKSNCVSCPLLIGDCISDDDSYFNQLLDAIKNKDIIEVTNLCIKIRDAEVIEGVECI